MLTPQAARKGKSDEEGIVQGRRLGGPLLPKCFHSIPRQHYPSHEPAFRVSLAPRLHDGISLKPTGIVHPKLTLDPIML